MILCRYTGLHKGGVLVIGPAATAEVPMTYNSHNVLCGDFGGVIEEGVRVNQDHFFIEFLQVFS